MHSLRLQAEDAAGNSHSIERTVFIDRSAPAQAVDGLIEYSESDDGKIRIAGSDGSVEANAWVEITNTRTGETLRVQADANGAFSAALTGELGDQITITVIDSASNSSEPLQHTYTGNLPPDPATVAPPLPTTGITPPWEQWTFIHSGSNPIQRELAPDTLVDLHVALLRGTVLDMAGEPLPGVRISIKDHPEYGHTLSRLDGMWDMVINGGGANVVEYELEGYLPIQRRLDPLWLQTQYAEDVVMTPLDDQVTEIDTRDTSVAFHVATGAHVTDRFGERKLHMLFPAGTQAHYKLADGTQVDLDNFHVRATEYTVGDLGPNAMPGDLPPASMYTYAMELTVDEAVDAVSTDGRTVWFDESVPVYISNFAGIPTGALVPLGYYNRDIANWQTMPDGRVLKVTAIVDNKAAIDTSGNGIAATQTQLEELNVKPGELESIANIYSVGDSFWRVQVDHFSPYDPNYAPANWAPPTPDQPQTSSVKTNTVETGCKTGCIVDVLNQAVLEHIPLAGTEHHLVYRSDRSKQSLEKTKNIIVAITGDTPPNQEFEADLEIVVAGSVYRKSWELPANSRNVSHTYKWDGKDAFGRPQIGSKNAKITLTYRIQALPSISNTPIPGGSFGSFTGTIAGPAVRSALRTRALQRTWEVLVSSGHSLVTENAGLGSWTLSPINAFDPVSKITSFGNGSVSTSIPGSKFMYSNLINKDELLAVNGELYENDFSHGDGISSIAWQEDGSAYLASARKLWLLKPDNTLERFGLTENGSTVENNGDGGHYSGATFGNITDIEYVDGNLYIVDSFNIRRIDRNGAIDTFFHGDRSSAATIAGFGVDYNYTYPNGGGAIFRTFTEIAKTPDNKITICANAHYRVKLKGLEISESFGIFSIDESGELSPAFTSVTEDRSFGILKSCGYDEAGNLYASIHTRRYSSGSAIDYGIYRFNAQNGQKETIIGDGPIPYANFESGIAAEKYSGTHGTAYAVLPTDQGIYYSTSSALYLINNEGILERIAGTGASHTDLDPEADQGVPTLSTAYLLKMETLNQDPHGNVTLNTYKGGVITVTSLLPEEREGSYLTFDPSGAWVQIFDGKGRHVRTRGRYSQTVLQIFDYSESGKVERVTDRHGRSTTISRSGSTVSITSPDGQTTQLVLDTTGSLESVQNAIGQKWRMTYHSPGLLASFSKPNGASNFFIYDAEGRLTQDQMPLGGEWNLTSTETSGQKTVAVSSAMGRTTSYSRERSGTDYIRKVASPNGREVAKRFLSNGDFETMYPDGSTVTEIMKGDPEIGALSPLVHQTTTLPSGRLYTIEESRDVVRDVQGKLTQVTTTFEDTDRQRIISVYDIPNRTITTTTLQGVITTQTLDDFDRLVNENTSGLATTQYNYNADKLESISMGTFDRVRETNYNYAADGPSKGLLESVVDPIGRETTFTRDGIGQLTTQTLPDGRQVSYSYDMDGNVETITPPGRSAHVFHYDDRDLRTQLQPPALDSLPTLTEYSYNLDKQLTQIRRPDTKLVEFHYGASTGQLESVTVPRGGFSYEYHEQSKQLVNAITPEGNSLALSYDGPIQASSSWEGEVSGQTALALTNYKHSTQTVNDSNPINFYFNWDNLLEGAGQLRVKRSHAAGLISGTEISSITTTQDYNEFGEINAFAANVEAFNNTYTRDKLGRITTRTETLGGVTVEHGYVYDLAGRLTSVTEDGVETESYDYDANSNRVSSTVRGVTTAATVDAQDRLLTSGDTSYSYSLNGELASKTAGGVTTTFDYDVFGNLLSATLPGDVTIDYVVDAQHRRIGKKLNGVLVQGFLYQDQLNPIAELDGDNNVVSRFVYGTRPNVPDYLIKDGKNYRIIADHLGSPRLVVDTDTGEVVQQISYDTFGNILEDSNPGFQPFGFAGGIYDHHTQLTRFGARDYDASVGRWTAKDPIGFAGGDVNLYGYVAVDPVNFVDPSGEVSQHAVNFWAGFGDAITFGGTDWIRDQLGSNAAVDKCSGAYSTGETTGTAVGFLTGGSGAARAFGWTVKANRYNRGGGGVNAYKNGERRFGIDRHSFKHNGVEKTRLHYHRGKTKSQRKKHRPYQGGW